jgi:DNA-binding beta-propeller fold protein YncE
MDQGADEETGEATDLYPNRNADGPPVSRRGFVAGSAALGAAATAGCSGGGDGGGSEPDTGTDAATATPEQRDAVLVFNTGEMTVSVVDAAAQEVVETTHVGFTSTFPSNQYAPDLVDSASESVWGNVDRGVRAFGPGDLAERASVDTGSGANWQELTPDGRHLLVSAREPAHTQYKIDADPDSDAFGEVLGELDRSDEGGRGDNDGPGPCDITIDPDGEYAFVPDLYGDTLTVLDVEAFEIETQVEVDPREGDGGAPQPWMGTVDPQGERMLVEHRPGIETVWDVSDPTAPAEVARFDGTDGLGDGPLTSEISADGSTGYVFTRGSEDVTVVDLDALEITERIDLGGSAFTGTWDRPREFLYAPVRGENVVRVIDDTTGEVTATLDVGERPYGATALGVLPDPEPTGTAEAAASRLGLDDEGTAYCIGECACGHEL